MDLDITELNGQVVRVHRGWTQPKKLESNDSNKATRWRSSRKGSAAPPSSGSIVDPALSSSSSLVTQPRQPKRSKPSAAPQQYEFVHGTDPFRNRDPDVRKLVRTHVMRDSARKKKQQRELDPDRIEEKRLPLTEPFEEVPRDSKNVVEPACIIDDRAFRWNLKPSLSHLSINPDPHMSSIINDLNRVSRRMFPMEEKFKFNPVSPVHWFHFALADKALFHALMFTAKSYAALIDGDKDSRMGAGDFGMCIALVNERLADSRVEIADGTIGAVSCLSLVEVS